MMKTLITQFKDESDDFQHAPGFFAAMSIPEGQVNAIREAAKHFKALTGVEQIKIDLQHKDFTEYPKLVVIEKSCRKEFAKPDIMVAIVQKDGKFSLRTGYAEEDQGEYYGLNIYDSEDFSLNDNATEITDDCLEAFADDIAGSDGNWEEGEFFEEAAEVLTPEIVRFIKNKAITAMQSICTV